MICQIFWVQKIAGWKKSPTKRGFWVRPERVGLWGRFFVAETETAFDSLCGNARGNTISVGNFQAIDTFFHAYLLLSGKPERSALGCRIDLCAERTGRGEFRNRNWWFLWRRFRIPLHRLCLGLCKSGNSRVSCRIYFHKHSLSIKMRNSNKKLGNGIYTRKDYPVKSISWEICGK